MHFLRGIIICLIVILPSVGCSVPVELENINNNELIVKGKYFTLKGKVKKHHDLIINGQNIKDYSFPSIVF